MKSLKIGSLVLEPSDNSVGIVSFLSEKNDEARVYWFDCGLRIQTFRFVVEDCIIVLA